MPREGVSFEQVAAAAEALLSEGQQPSIRAVRERLHGTGSPNTIHRHLSEWRATRAGVKEPAPTLPAAIAREIHLELARVVAEARKDAEVRLAEVGAELSELARVGEALEAEREQLREQLMSLTRERDMLLGKTAEQGAELTRASQELAQARQAADALRIELTRAQLEVQGARTHGDAQNAELERLSARLRDAVRAHTDGEREQATLAAANQALTERLVDAQSREQAAQHVIAELRDRIEKLSGDERRDATERARLLGELKASQETIQRVDDEVRRLREELSRARQEAAAHARELMAARDAAHASALEQARLLGRREALLGANRPASRAKARSKERATEPPLDRTEPPTDSELAMETTAHEGTTA